MTGSIALTLIQLWLVTIFSVNLDIILKWLPLFCIVLHLPFFFFAVISYNV